MKNFATVLVLLICSFASAQTKIPITSNYIYQDNSQLDKADKLIDGNTNINYSPLGPKLYKQHEIVFDLITWRASVSSVKIYIGNPDTGTVKVILVQKNFAEKEIGTFTAPAAAKLKERRPLGWMAGANGHSWDLMNDAKLNVIKSLGIETGALR